ncbi:MAG TPA: hypothetical protein DEP72_04755 [Clostridiales bacterium]|nr:MAG: hypothetical protein A2Y18_05550 [Clostridiales bacterium GWD2_32_19]HCC07452.1 hypothetical protein [Clostridiales bacterium]
MNNNTIKLSLPLNPAYVSTIRLTSSSISERMNFNISEVEDIKTAISETATYIINSCDPQHCSSFDVTFKMENEKLFVDILIPTSCSDFLESKDNMSLIMIKGCMNEFKVDKDTSNNVTNIHLMKLKG